MAIHYTLMRSPGTIVDLGYARRKGERIGRCCVCLERFEHATQSTNYCSACGMHYHVDTCSGLSYVPFFHSKWWDTSSPGNTCRGCYEEWSSK